jgi:hypothetical protein
MTFFRIEFLAPMGNPKPYLDELVNLWRWEQAAEGRVIVSPHRRNVIGQIEQELKNQEQQRRLRYERVD